MKRSVFTLLLALFTLSLVLLPACGGGGGGGGGNSLVGTWQITSMNGNPVPTNTAIYTFKADGTGAATVMGQSLAFAWLLNGNKLTLTANNSVEVSTVTWISSNKFQLTDANGVVAIFEN